MPSKTTEDQKKELEKGSDLSCSSQSSLFDLITPFEHSLFNHSQKDEAKIMFDKESELQHVQDEPSAMEDATPGSPQIGIQESEIVVQSPLNPQSPPLFGLSELECFGEERADNGGEQKDVSKRHECEKCGMSFGDRQETVKHENECKVNLSCSKCDFEATTMKLLVDHVMAHIDGECDLCGFPTIPETKFYELEDCKGVHITCGICGSNL